MTDGRFLFGLLGSGEFEPWAEGVDRWLLERATGNGSVLILPTASAPEGDDVFDMWAQKGLEHYRRLGILAEVVPLKTRVDGGSEGFASMLQHASMVFFSGGNPAYLANTMMDTLFWRKLLAELPRGLAYVGCSAGMAALGELAPDTAVGEQTANFWRPGLRLFPDVYFGPHWDKLDTYVPGLQELFIASVPSTSTLLAIDENTAVVGDGSNWTVLGAGSAHLLEGGSWRRFQSGQSFTVDLDVLATP